VVLALEVRRHLAREAVQLFLTGLVVKEASSTFEQ
jgi:hypothetical protein